MNRLIQHKGSHFCNEIFLSLTGRQDVVFAHGDRSSQGDEQGSQGDEQGSRGEVQGSQGEERGSQEAERGSRGEERGSRGGKQGSQEAGRTSRAQRGCFMQTEQQAL